MRIAAVLALLLGLLAGVAMAQDPEDRVLPGVGAGRIRLGASPAGLTALWGAPRRRLAEARNQDPSAPLYYYEYPEHGVWLIVQNDRIRKIGLENGKWRTREGICLWSTVDQVRRAYGKGRSQWPDGFDPKKPELIPRYFLKYETRGIDFLIQKKSRLVEALHVYPPVKR